jgi:uncharacterized peroxidase-related enzyme
MPFIEPVSEEGASDEARALLEADRERLGYVPTFGRVFAQHPAVYSAWQELNGAIKAEMSLRRYELVTLAAARRLRSSYCSLAHGSVLLQQFLDRDELRRVALDHSDAGLDQVDVAVMDLAEKVVDDATSVTEEDVQRLRDLGLTDKDVLDVVLRPPRAASSRRRSTPSARSPTPRISRSIRGCGTRSWSAGRSPPTLRNLRYGGPVAAGAGSR